MSESFSLLAELHDTGRRELVIQRNVTMQHKTFSLLVGSLLAGFFSGTSSAQTTKPADTLAAGSAAPALAIDHWYKGTPVSQFEPGHVYVVEFWATWCGPCKENIPHLTELQKSHADQVTVIGVDIGEHPAERTDAKILQMVTKFVDGMGPKMDYTVAGDGIEGKMAKGWLEAAGVNSIPTAFLIGRDGMVEWVGQPVDMAPALDGVLAGHWDRAAERQREESNRTATSQGVIDLHKFLAASEAKDPKAMQAAVDLMAKDGPGFDKRSGNGIAFQMQIYVLSDANAAVSYARELTAPGRADAATPGVAVAAILAAMPSAPTKAMTTDTLKTIASLCESAFTADAPPPKYAYFSMAQLEATIGNLDAAIKYQEKGVQVLKEEMEGGGHTQPAVVASEKKQMERAVTQLQSYRDRAKAAA